MDTTARRVLAAATGLVALVVGAAVACRPGEPPRTTRTTATTGTTGTTPTVPGTIDCGTYDYGATPPTTTIGAPQVTCIRNALAAGTPARLVTTNTRDNRFQPIGTVVYEVLGRSQLRVTTGDLVQLCTSFHTDTAVLWAGNCTPQPPAAPPLTGTDCGTINYASGWPTTMVQNLQFGPGRCLLDAWAAGTPARLTTREQTDGRGSHIRITIYDVLGTGQLRVTTDNRQAAGGGDVTTQRCTTLEASFAYLEPAGCTPA